MVFLRLLLPPLFLLSVWILPAQTTAYVPPPGRWEHRTPQQVGLHADSVAAAVQIAHTRENRQPRDLELTHYQTFGREPFGDAIGPFRERGEPTGLIIRNGYIVAEWGEPARVDMTFSVTKSFLSTVVGLAVDSGLIRSVKDTVADYMGPIVVLDQYPGAADKATALGRSKLLDLFASGHNRRITWDDLLRQTSDWEGTLWGKPDWADRPSGDPSTWMTRERHAPGAVYEYNDTRVNVLALAATQVWRRPLPQVLREKIMDPIGASPTWRWYGYENSWIVLDGLPVQAVSGGGHWGGGMFINAYDQARFGLLTLRRGRWGNRQLLSESWVRQALTPTSAQKDYGFMNWYLNTDRELLPSAPAEAFMHIGAGNNLIYVDPVNDLVIVARWIERAAMDAVVGRVIGGLRR